MFLRFISFILSISAILVTIPTLASNVNLGSATTLNPTNSSDCALLWQASGADNLFGQSLPVANSSTNHISILPVDPNQADKMKIDASVLLNTNLSDVRLAADIDTNIKIQNPTDPQASSQTFDLNLNSIVDLSGVYFKLNRFNVSNLNTSGATGDWYGQYFNLNTDQTNATKDIFAILAEVLQTPKSQVYSVSSESRIQKMLCNLVAKVDVSASQNISLGSGSLAQNKQVRVISVTFKENYQELLTLELPEVIETLLNDSTFNSFLKAQYPRLVRFIKAMDSISKTNSTIPSQIEYNMVVDNLKNIYKKDTLTKSMQESLAQSQAIITQTVEENKYLIDANNNQVYGMISQVKIVFTDKGASSYSSDVATRNLLKSGIRVRLESFDYKMGNQVNKVELPSSFKPASAFNDLMNKNNTKTAEPITVPKSTRFEKLRSRLVSCEGKTGKILNNQGAILKKTPRGSSVVFADATGLALVGEKDVVSCLKNANKTGFLTCKNNLDQRVNFKGQKAGRPSEKGYLFYMSDDFSKLFTSKFNTVSCTNDATLLNL